MHCSYCSSKVATSEEHAGRKEAVCARCAPLYPRILTASQGDGVFTLRELMIRQNEGDYLRKSISTVSIQILVYFDSDYKLAGFEITHHLLGWVIKWRGNGPVLKYSSVEMMRSYWNHYQLSPNDGFDTSKIVAEINGHAMNLHPFVINFLTTGLTKHES